MTKTRYFVLLLPALAFADFRQLPLQFEINRGQGPSTAQFVARGLASQPSGVALALRADEATFAIGETPVRMKILGANRSAPGRGEDPLPGISNYFLGQDPSKWRTGIETYRRIRYSEVYRGIDLIYYGTQGELEYDFLVKPGATVDTIALEFEGIRSVRIDANGELVLQTNNGEVRHRRPVVYQEVGNRRVEVAGGYRLLGRRRAGFRVGAYDKSRELVVDPRLLFSTHFGGRLRESAHSVAVDRQGNVYVAGLATSPDFPSTPGVLQSNVIPPGNDLFVVKINPTGTAVLYSTLIGGSDNEMNVSLAVDQGGNAYVAGTTRSINFPTTPAAHRSQPAGSTDGFVAKLNSSGSGLLYATRLGGSAAENIYGVAVDASGNAHVTGDTQSTNFPVTSETYQEEIRGTIDAFVTKFNASGTGLLFSTFLGGDSDSPTIAYESGRAIAVDRTGSVYVAGITSLRDFPILEGAFQATHGGLADGFLTRLSADGKTVGLSTFLGGEDNDTINCIALDGNGGIYLGGNTLSVRFPTTPGAVMTVNNGGNIVASDGFVTRINANGGALYSTYLGGGGDDTVNGIAADAAGNAYAFGTTNSTQFPTTFDAIQASRPTSQGEPDNAFLTQINPAGTQIAYSTYLGGSRLDQGNAIARDQMGNLFVAGYTQSNDFPTNAGALQRRTGFGVSTAFISRIGEANLAPSVLRAVSATAFVADEGTELNEPLVVELLDQFNNPQPLVTINFTATNATLDGAAALTGNDGRASVRVRLTGRPGTATVTAQFGNLPTVTFIITVRRVGPPLPQINRNGVVGAGLSTPPVRQVSVAGIVSIFGSNFAPAGTNRSVGQGDLVDGKLPNSFAGVCVTFNGVAARIFSVSDTQVNVQVPELPSIGESRVVVISNCGQPGELRSDEEIVEVLSSSPEFFYYARNSDGRNPVAAVNSATGALVGPPGAIAGATLVPANPNDIVILFATGFGVTRPSVGTGELPTGPASCATTPIVMLDGEELSPEFVLYCGVTPGLAGVYQLNLRVPAGVRNGNLALAVRFGLQASPAGGFLHVAGGADRDPHIAVSPVRMDFGDIEVGQVRTRQLTIANSGTAPLQVREFAPGLPVFTVLPSIAFRLEPGQQRIVEVQLAASAIGQINSTLTIRSDDPENPNLAVPLVANVTGQAPIPNPAPVLANLSPDSIEAAGAAFNLVVNGSNFVRSSVVEWNGQARSTFFNHAGQLIAFITTQDILAAGTARVTVFTPAPGGGRSNTLDFTVRSTQTEGPRVLISQFDPIACPDITSYVSVLDPFGLPVGGLNSANLSCTVDGLPVSCTTEPETEVPFSVVLVPGLNGLTRDEDVALMKNAVRSFVTGLPDNTRISLIHLEDVARPLVPFTEDKDRINTLVDQLRVVPPGNALYDAVTLAVTQARNERSRRVAIVLITALDNLSGNERGPTSPLGNARIEGLPFFTFAIGAGSTDVNLTGFLRELSRNTGGQLVTQPAPLEFGRMMTTMNQILLGQYRVRHVGLALDNRIRTLGLTFQTPFGTATGSRTYACVP